MEIVNVSFGGGMSMQLTPVVVGLSSRVTTIVEGNTFVITFTTNTPSAYPYTITGVSSADIGNASLTGTFTANGETRTYTISDDLVTEGRETFLMTMDNGQAGAAIGIDDSYYTLTANRASINEGNSFTVTFDTNGFHTFPLGYTITGVLSNNFIGSPSLTGNLTSNGQVLTFTANSDLLSEGVQYFLISLNNGRANANVLINDTSNTGQQIQFTTAGTYSWAAPVGVTQVSAVVIGGGAGGSSRVGGGGGGLAYGNASVTPGQFYTVVVGAGGGVGTPGGNSFFISNTTIFGGGGSIGIGSAGGAGGVSTGTLRLNGGAGGAGGGTNPNMGGGGGGAGGYSGAGGAGATGTNTAGSSAGASGSGGAGGGGASGVDTFYGFGYAGGGGGVGIYGAGSSGAGGAAHGGSGTGVGKAGVGGSNGANGTIGGGSIAPYGGDGTGFAGSGGAFGGGGGAGPGINGTGGLGAVRIIWGAGRYYPSTNVANVY